MVPEFGVMLLGVRHDVVPGLDSIFDLQSVVSIDRLVLEHGQNALDGAPHGLDVHLI